MTPPRFFMDEDIYGAVTIAFRKAGLDAISTPDTGRRGESDESQLMFAANAQRVLVTFNVAHFAELHSEWISKGRDHWGIVVSRQRTIGETLRRLVHLARSMDADAMRNRLEFLTDW